MKVNDIVVIAEGGYAGYKAQIVRINETRADETNESVMVRILNSNGVAIKSMNIPVSAINNYDESKIRYVLYVEGKGSPSKVHFNKQNAREEMDRIAQKTPNTRVYLFESIEDLIYEQKLTPVKRVYIEETNAVTDEQ